MDRGSADSDIYVQTSFSEAYCITVAEARILCRPIITTDAPGLREQITDGENGVILGTMSPDALFEYICSLMDDAELRELFACRLQECLVSDENELPKLYLYIME